MTTDSTESSKNHRSNANSPDHNKCIQILNLVLDDEATDEEYQYFKNHVQNCMPYYEIYNIDLKIKELIRKNCAQKEVPQDLIESIKSKILQDSERA